MSLQPAYLKQSTGTTPTAPYWGDSKTINTIIYDKKHVLRVHFFCKLHLFRYIKKCKMKFVAYLR